MGSPPLPGRVQLRIDLAKYKSVDLTVDDALRLLDKLVEKLGRSTTDIDETRRYLRNFNEFYEYMQKKFKDYIAPPHRPDDYIRGNVVIDKVKLYVRDGEKRVVLVFDRHVDQSLIEDALRSLGYDVEVIKEF